MPEAAEVRRIVDQLQKYCGSTVVTTGIVSGRYSRSPIKAFESLTGYVLQYVFCRGKCIFMCFVDPETDIEVWGISTLGLTGDWRGWQLGASNPNVRTEQKHMRFFIALNDGYNTAVLEYHDQRNFGTFKLVWKKQAAEKHLELGPEPISLFVPLPRKIQAFPVTFPNMLEILGVPAGELAVRAKRFGKKHTVATAMLDQRIFCGVGNYVRADACYLAKIDPRRPLSSLSEKELNTLFGMCGVVCFEAYNNPAKYVNTCYQQQVSPNGNPIESYIDANGRTMWWCPAEQASLDL